MTASNTKTSKLQDFRINCKIRLAALWTAVMFCYVYGDFFLLFVPGHIKRLMEGQSGVGNTTPVSLLAFAVLMTIPSLMIFLSLVLSAVINRWTNIITGIFFTGIMILVIITSSGKWMLFYTYLGLVEIILTVSIVWHALKWPKEAS